MRDYCDSRRPFGLRKNSGFLVLIAALAVLLIAGPGFGVTWDIHDSFSGANNPNGVWTYGYRVDAESTGLTTSFVHQWLNWRAGGWTGVASYASNCQTESWHVNSGADQQWCGVNKVGPDPYTFEHAGLGNLVISPSYVSGYETTVIRWTAPTSGDYVVSAKFTLMDDRHACDSRGTVAYVLKKGVALGAGLVTGNYMDYYSFPATTVTCNASDTIEFAAHYQDLALPLAITGSIQPVSAVPTFVTYRGKLSNPDNSPVTDGNYSFIFKIFSAETGGSPVWTAARTGVDVAKGLFTARISDIDPNVIRADTGLWLELTVNGEALASRIQVGADFQTVRAGSTGN